MSAAPAAAWFPDPSDPSQLRWWDGVQWTEHRHPAAPPVAPIAAAPQPQVQPQLIVMPGMMGAAPVQHHAADPALSREQLQLQREHLDLQREQMQRARERDERHDQGADWSDRIQMFFAGMSIFRMFRHH